MPAARGNSRHHKTRGVPLKVVQESCISGFCLLRLLCSLLIHTAPQKHDTWVSCPPRAFEALQSFGKGMSCYFPPDATGWSCQLVALERMQTETPSWIWQTSLNVRSCRHEYHNGYSKNGPGQQWWLQRIERRYCLASIKRPSSVLHELQKHYILINFKCLTHKAVSV